jgi:hypothetical protein
MRFLQLHFQLDFPIANAMHNQITTKLYFLQLPTTKINNKLQTNPITYPHGNRFKPNLSLWLNMFSTTIT